MSDEPIIEQQYLGGVNVVDIEDVRVARGKTRRPHSSCPHVKLVYDAQERRIWCKDCEKDVDSFDAFSMLAERSSEHQKRLEREAKRLDELAAFQMRSLAAKSLDEAWRKKRSVPACPSCSRGLLPEDFKNGVGVVSKELELAFRKRQKQQTR